MKSSQMDNILFGVAYYDEYMPYDRLDKDIELMKKAGINTVRIAESTWSTCEPQPGVFDWSHVDRVIDAMEEAGINVIIGTPTYAVPTWLVKAYPDVLATTINGKGKYGARQIMDITHPAYLFHAERVIRELISRTANRKAVIGFQVDNETKYYGTAGNNVQQRFIKYIRAKFNDDLDALNHEFGFDYWSNRINAWEDFPNVLGTINGSLASEFEKFQRTLVDEFLAWQVAIVNEYKREDQFVTHNFDFEWRGHSFGVQPDVNHFHAAKPLTIAGVDIYHPTQDNLTGKEIAFGGDITRSLKDGKNYLVIETEAQGFPGWTPYKGQLRLQAYSHLASGANSVMYWHWHSIHNSFETYWKGLLSHDFAENAVYKEAAVFGDEIKRIGEHLVNIKKSNKVAILISNEALTALKHFGIQATAGGNTGIRYNDVFRWIYDALFELNIECDILWPDTINEKIASYQVVIVPALYATPDSVLQTLDEYAKNGGVLVTTFKTAFANENVKVSTEIQPRILSHAIGAHYHQFTFPNHTKLEGEIIKDDSSEANIFMELLIPDQAKALVKYAHPSWSEYAAITENSYGKGKVYHIGAMVDNKVLKTLYCRIFKEVGIALSENHFPVIVRQGTNSFGKTLSYYLNYSGDEVKVTLPNSGRELVSDKQVSQNQELSIQPWNLLIIES